LFERGFPPENPPLAVAFRLGTMSEEISSTSLVCVTPAGERLPVIISIGRPVKNDDGFWECPVSLHGLYPRLSSMKSDDSFHALCLSVHLVRDLLMGFMEEGGRILIAGTEDEQELPLDAYFPPYSHSSGEPRALQSDLDDGQRPEWGVGVFVRETGNGLRLIFDTMKRAGKGKPNWESWAFITHSTIDRTRFLSQQLSEEEYAALGRTVLGVLTALVEKNDME
jgi:hypothetical protein